MSEIPDPDKFWNCSTALRRMGDDVELLSDMICFFQQDSAILLQQLTTLIERKDFREAERVAHSLKGLCSNFEAKSVVDAAANLEAACRDEDSANAALLLMPLELQLNRLSSLLGEWQNGNTHS